MKNDSSKKYRFNLIDVISLTIILIVLITSYITYTYKAKDGGQNTVLTVRVENNINNDVNMIYSEALREKEVYFNSSNTPVQVISVTRTSPQFLDIKILGKGKISNERYVFNGQKVLIGQKAEVHGNYWARGKILNIRYEK